MAFPSFALASASIFTLENLKLFLKFKMYKILAQVYAYLLQLFLNSHHVEIFLRWMGNDVIMNPREWFRDNSHPLFEFGKISKIVSKKNQFSFDVLWRKYLLWNDSKITIFFSKIETKLSYLEKIENVRIKEKLFLDIKFSNLFNVIFQSHLWIFFLKHEFWKGIVFFELNTSSWIIIIID